VAASLSFAASGQGAADPTPPVITSMLTGTLGSNGWHTSNVTIEWTESDPDSGISETVGCDTRTLTASMSVTCSATNGAGVRSSSTVNIKIDKVAPTVTAASAARAADANGWYNHAVSFSFTGTDTTSGIGSCDAATYSGPDSANASITGTCRDKAGNSAARAFPLAYDATQPSVRPVPARPPDKYGWYSRDVEIAFAGGDATSGVDACSRVRYGAPNSGQASVVGSCRDRAGNEALSAFHFKYSEPLLAPRSGTRSSTPPLLDWIDVRRARFYNVQIWRKGQKILSRWPRGSQFQLRRSWQYAGQRRTLAPGRYTAYVWPRIGGRYGRLLGRTTFYIVRATTT
jgi:hypothetical protein